MNVRRDTVLDLDSKILFQGTTDETVEWLDENPVKTPLWVSIGETGDIMTSSQYLDLAT